MKYRHLLATLAIVPGALLGALYLQGCFGADSSPDGIIASYEDSQNLPFTDAYIEYPGPQESWAGPSSFILHVTTRETPTAQVSISPAMFEVQAPKGAEKERRLASPPGMPADAAREELARLFTSLQGQEQSFAGCLYPIWVRLIRGDGTLVERRGCRGQAGWPRVASEIVNHFIEASVYAQVIVRKPSAESAPKSKGKNKSKGGQNKKSKALKAAEPGPSGPAAATHEDASGPANPPAPAASSDADELPQTAP